MLNLKEGRPIAIIKNGKNHNKIIYINSGDDEESNVIDNNPLDMLEDIYVNNKKKMSRKDIITIKNALSKRDDPDYYEDSVYEILNDARGKNRELSKKEFKIFDDGIVQPLPRFNKTERCFIAGQTECGKTHYCKKYLEQLVKVHPEKNVYVFSDVEKDPELEGIENLVRFRIDEEVLNKKPIQPEKFKDSICVFDDIDSIQNEKVYKYIQNLRDSILRRGRHENISCIVTSHLITNYKDTRIILNECNSITIFCRSGSTYGINYLLKKYIGLGKDEIRKIINLPSRWVTIYKNHPQYVLYEKGIYIL